MIKKKVVDFLSQIQPYDLKSLSPELLNSEVSLVTADSRNVTPNSIFIAIQGETSDGHEYIHSAVEKGAILVVGERRVDVSKIQVPYIQIDSGKRILSQFAAVFYDHPTKSMLILGVTGTSGKTTTTYLLESILKAAGYKVGVIGTVNFRFGSKVFPSTHTTPGAVELQSLLAQMKFEGCNAVVMEVSSHALAQHRVDHVSFDGVIFTNLSPEHLDFHTDMEDYFHSKSLLFTLLIDFSISQGKRPVGVINELDDYGNRLSQLATQRNPSFKVYKFGKNLNLSVLLDGISGTIEDVKIQSPLTGEFNVSNIAGAVTLAKALNIPANRIEKGICNLTGIPGRLEKVINQNGIHIWVDYAHKPDALEKVIRTLKNIKGNGQLLTVFGCGGDRDRKKRPVMGKTAVELSDYVFITSDNPRTEDPNAIIGEILQGVQGYSNFLVEVDRKKAIFAAIHRAKKGDLVLIAGKGHEDYQILGKTKIHFDDREVATEASLARTK